MTTQEFLEKYLPDYEQKNKKLIYLKGRKADEALD